MSGTGYPAYDAAHAFAVRTWGERVRVVNYVRPEIYEVRLGAGAREHAEMRYVSVDSEMRASDATENTSTE